MAEHHLTHLQHPEERSFGKPSDFLTSVNHLSRVHDTLVHPDKPASITLSTKFDGAPSIIFGHHPKSGKFFVATKSAFAKKPKLNYSNEDIETNHPQSGLRSKLKSALEHLPKVTPKTGVFQGDIMHTPESVKREGGNLHFKPNVISYSTPKNSEEGYKINRSKIGMVVHTKYEGHNIASMKASPYSHESEFASHPDVHLISHKVESSPSNYNKADRDKFTHHLFAATKQYNLSNPNQHETTMLTHQPIISRYVNNSVKTGKAPSLLGYRGFVENHFNTLKSNMKSERGQQNIESQHQRFNNDIVKHHEMFNRRFIAHNHMTTAKNILVKGLSGGQKYEHHIEGQKTEPEGFVVSHHGKMSKLVNRNNFSRANMAKEGKRRFE